MNLLIIAALVAIIVIFGERQKTDGADEHGYRWVQVRPPLPADARTFHFVPDGDIGLQCGLEWGALECVRVDRQAWRGDAYLPVGAPQWLIEHATRHLDGWDHPARQLNF